MDVILLNVIFAEFSSKCGSTDCHSAECFTKSHSSECHNAECSTKCRSAGCHAAECRGANPRSEKLRLNVRKQTGSKSC